MSNRLTQLTKARTNPIKSYCTIHYAMKIMNVLFHLASLLFSLLLLLSSEAQEDELWENRDKWETMAWDGYKFNIQQRSNRPAPFSGNLLVQVFQNQDESVIWRDQDVTNQVTGTVPAIPEFFVGCNSSWMPFLLTWPIMTYTDTPRMSSSIPSKIFATRNFTLTFPMWCNPNAAKRSIAAWFVRCTWG